MGLCKGQKFGHNYVAGICTECRGKQNHFLNKQKMVDIRGFFDRMAELKKEKFQYTRHQHDAIETAEMFDDMKSKGIYLRLFKMHDREKLLKCREWVNEKGQKNKGRLFVSVYKKFL